MQFRGLVAVLLQVVERLVLDRMLQFLPLAIDLDLLMRRIHPKEILESRALLEERLSVE